MWQQEVHMKQPGKYWLGSIVLMLAAGCATTPPTTLSGMREEQAQILIARCYMARAGERLLVGPGPVFTACSRWAHAAVRVRYGQSSTQQTAFGTK